MSAFPTHGGTQSRRGDSAPSSTPRKQAASPRSSPAPEAARVQHRSRGPIAATHSDEDEDVTWEDDKRPSTQSKSAPATKAKIDPPPGTFTSPPGSDDASIPDVVIVTSSKKRSHGDADAKAEKKKEKGEKKHKKEKDKDRDKSKDRGAKDFEYSYAPVKDKKKRSPHSRGSDREHKSEKKRAKQADDKEAKLAPAHGQGKGLNADVLAMLKPGVRKSTSEKQDDAKEDKSKEDAGKTPAVMGAPATKLSDDAAAKQRAKGLAGLGDIAELQKKIQEEHSKLKLFIMKAKHEWEEKREREKKGGKEVRGETNEQEYYVATPGEVLGPEKGRDYLCEAPIGKGVFSSVYQVKNTKEGFQCAVKIVRANNMMRKAAVKEVELVRRLMAQGDDKDREGQHYIIRLLGQETFEHQGHMCMIFELLKCDLRSALSHYGLGKGLPLQTVQQYSKQIFLALRFLRKVKVIHGDVKPDNILMSLSKLEVKLCDFGSAMNVTETVSTAYAQPRYYRSPEIMIGLPYDTQVDLWSAGVTLFELATGKILFTGKSNNAMIRQILEVSGKFSERMLKKGTCSSKHFNKDTDFLLKDPDSITGEPEVLPAKRFFKAPRSVLSMMDKTLQDPPPNSARETQERLMPRAADLITKCTRPDPEDRFMPEHAVLHAFFNLDR